MEIYIGFHEGGHREIHTIWNTGNLESETTRRKRNGSKHAQTQKRLTEAPSPSKAAE